MAKRLLVLVGVLTLCALHSVLRADAPGGREELKKTFQAGNYKDAYEGLRRFALDPQDDPRQVGEDLTLAVQALRNLGRVDEVDDFREAVIKVHADNWRLLQAAANSIYTTENYGYMVAGKFSRGNHRGGGKLVNSAERDRIRALQLMVQGMPTAEKDERKDEAGRFLIDLANLLLGNRGYDESWRLQYLSDLAELPDYQDGWYYGRATSGAPVDAEGVPVFYHVPKSFADAENDGQRWRWCLSRAAEIAPSTLNETRKRLADFLQQQFGVQTMAQYGWFFARGQEDDTRKDTSGPYDLQSLAKDETIAQLATGIRRFKLPGEFDYIKIYEQIADQPQTGHADEVLDQLAQIFENRQQYDQAADYWRRNIKEHGPGPNNYRQQRLDQIVGNWGRFETVMGQPAGQGATIDFRFRNGKKVKFEAQAIRVEKLLEDVKGYLKSHPNQLDWQKINLGDIGYRLVFQNEQQYVGDKVADWELELQPRPHHLDKRITVTTPLQSAGAYLLTATMPDGNVSKVVVWLSDTALIKKPLVDKTFYYLGDAVTGEPIAHANLEFFGYLQKHLGNNNWQVDTLDFAEFTDATGQAAISQKQQPIDHQWMVIARTDKGRFAYLGFTNVWNGQNYDQQYNLVKVFTITDRPVYRPQQQVKFKFWVRHAQYDQADTSSFAGQEFAVEVLSPKGEKILTRGFKADDYGGFEGELDLAQDATLGVYQIFIPTKGGGTFRVEEYKKPEFEVSVDAPTKPVMLGEKISAKIKAKYYFGAPVVKAKVSYKVMRTSYTARWYPPGPWDWFYGPGYWWFACDYDWYPGWRQWGCRRPSPWWWGQAQQQPEIVAQREVPIGPDGTVNIEIDTGPAKEIHPDEDHQYQITAEVVDDSRRTIVGTGTVLVARKPFQVTVWPNRGYYRTGDAIEVDVKAQTLDRKPVAGTGTLTLLAITYDKDNKPVEKPVDKWKLDTGDQGEARQQIKAAAPGQYRLSYKLTDADKHTIEGGYVFTIIGPTFNGATFRFNDIELIADKRQYAPGEKVKLQVNANRPDSLVLLFVRPANGIYLMPQVLRIDGKSTVREIEIAQKDMPNLFVEAVTISGGRVFSEVKEIVVPPEQRILNLEVIPSAESYKPGQKAKVQLKVTDSAGKPFVGSTVTAIYDKSVEYISGGSNVPEIKAFFWKWRRMHHPQTESNLGRAGGNMTLPNQLGMQNLGVFGELVVQLADGAQDRAGIGQNGQQYRKRGAAPGAAVAGFAGRDMARQSAAAKSLRAEGGEQVEADAAKKGEQQNGLNAEAEGLDADEAGAGAAELLDPQVRSKFADTALWVAALTTDDKGLAEISLDMPENLTTWKIRTWGMGHGTRVGQGEAEVITRKDLIVRMQAPRFFVQTDEVVLSANVHNYLAKPKRVKVVLELDGGELKPLAEAARTIEVADKGEARVDWRVKAAQEGEAVVRMKALTDEESDAMEMKFPVYVHGMLKTESFSGAIRPDKEKGQVSLRVPAERRISQSRLEVRYTPTLAGAMVDALPYLVNYPHDSTDQTLCRFLPTVITQKILLDMKLDLKAIRDKRNNLNAQEIGDPANRAAQWKRWDRNPVFDPDEVRDMVKSGVQRLTEMQCSDGGWGWFSGWGEHSWPHTTAYVVHGLQLAKQNEVALVPGTLERGVAWLTNYQNQQVQMLKNADGKVNPWKQQADALDALIFMVLVDGDVKNDAMRDFLFRDRTHLPVYAKALFGLALEKLQDKPKLDMILQNISQYLVEDEENQTAYLKLPDDNYWWYWYGSEVEANAFYLKLLARTDPKGEVASRLVKYLLNNRKHATYWNSTRDTGFAIEALADFLRASGEDKPDLTIEVWLDGTKRKEVKVNSENLFTFDGTFLLEGDAVESGVHQLELRKQGQGPVYFNAYLTNFTLEDFITKAGLEIKVNRKYYKLRAVDKKIKVAGSRGQAVDQRVEKYERQELPNLATLNSGDLVEIELEIDSKNDYEYLMFEDMKAAGFEPVETRSGYNGNSLGAYMELRDNRVSFFVRAFARGKHSVSYRMRAEVPGKFSALPSQGSGVYAPELKANSDEIKLRIEDAEPAAVGK